MMALKPFIKKKQKWCTEDAAGAYEIFAQQQSQIKSLRIPDTARLLFPLMLPVYFLFSFFSLSPPKSLFMPLLLAQVLQKKVLFVLLFPLCLTVQYHFGSALQWWIHKYAMLFYIIVYALKSIHIFLMYRLRI